MKPNDDKCASAEVTESLYLRASLLLTALRNLERGYDRRFAANFESEDIFAVLPEVVDYLRAECEQIGVAV